MLKIASNTTVVKQALKKVNQANKSAFVSALNKTAFDIRDMEKYEMEKVFDRPTPFTLNSVYLGYATQSKPEAFVAIKRSSSMYHYIRPNIYGGDRPQKRFELMLRRIGILGQNEVTVPAPGSGVRRDMYGNMARGQYVEILSQLQAFYLAGSQQNETPNSRARNVKKHYKARYFVARKGESRVGGGSWKGGEKVQHLKTGIWAKYKTVFGSAIKPVLFFAPKASYKRIYDFYGVAEKTANKRFGPQFIKAMDKFINRQLDTSKKGMKWY